DRLTHTVEHLNLIAVLGHAELLGRHDRVRQTANVVAAEGGIDNIIALQEQACQPFVVSVGLCLIQENGYRPALLFGPGDLAVPIGSLHQSDAEAPVSWPRPLVPACA